MYTAVAMANNKPFVITDFLIEWMHIAPCRIPVTEVGFSVPLLFFFLGETSVRRSGLGPCGRGIGEAQHYPQGNRSKTTTISRRN